MIDKFFSYDQLAIAWQHIGSGQNLTYKHYFRHIYLGFELGLERNLNILSSRLQAAGFQSNKVVRLFIPKGTSSQRPITLLPVEEQIAYQAIAAKIADEISSRRKHLEYKVVFSNILSSDRSTFLFENWKYCYNRFQNKTEENVLGGMPWVVTCDLASFYDTISHEILFNNVPSLRKNQESRNFISDILSKWTFEKTYETRRHGLPQGPIASDLLAEVFLLIMDEKLSPTVNYIRYVDDIRIFAASKSEAQTQALELERFIRRMGLVPQSEKFSILKLETGLELHKIEASQADEAFEDLDGESQKLSKGETESILKMAVSPMEAGMKPLHTPTRYGLFRGMPNEVTVKIALSISEACPQHIEAVFVFLRRFKDRGPGLELAKSLLEVSPFGFIRMKCWEYFHFAYAGIPDFEARRLAEIACKILMNQSTNEPTTILGAAKYLFKHAHVTRTAYGKFPFNISNRLILALALRSLEGGLQGVGLNEYRRLHSDVSDVGLAALHCYQSIGKYLIEAVNKNKKIDSSYINSLKTLAGIDLPKNFSDPISAGLNELLGIKISFDPRKVLGKNWNQVYKYIVRANVYKKQVPATWLRSINGINEILVRSFIEIYNKKIADIGLKIKVKDKYEKPLSYGKLIDEKQKLATLFPGKFKELVFINRVRNNDQESHPFIQKTGRRAKHTIKQSEIAKLSKQAAEAIINIDELIVNILDIKIVKRRVQRKSKSKVV